MLTPILYALLLVLASVVTAVAGLLLAQRLIPLHIRERHNVTPGIIYWDYPDQDYAGRDLGAL